MIRDELGVGGMAVVYRAEDTTLRREVAVKCLLPHMVRRDELAGRFMREARAAAALDHPGIMKVFDVGSGDDTGTPPYIVMELLRGASLKDFLERAGAPLAEMAALLGSALADALHAAHQAGVIHRDVKPANVMIREDGRPVLCDFGVARLANDDAILTQTGLVLGTPVFMAPEQAMSQPVDARSDVYSLGATLYQIATGALPFSGTTAAVISAVTRGEFVPPARRNPTIGNALGREIMKAMAREPAARHQSAAELSAALAAIGRVPGLGDGPEELKAYFADPAAWNARARPLIIAAAMVRAEGAARRREYARALAECDRVLAMDPQHAGATELVGRVGQGARRWKRVALAGAGLAAAAVLAVGGVKVFGGGSTAAPGGSLDASLVGSALPPDAAPVDAALAAYDVPDAALAARLADAAPSAVAAVAARPGRRATPPDAAVAVAVATLPPDAAPVTPAAPSAPGHVKVKIGPYCDISIDGVAHGQSPSAARIDLPPGKHVLVCKQAATGRQVTREFFLDPNEELEVQDSLIPQVAVTIDLRARAVLVDGVRHDAREKVTLSTGRHRMVLVQSDETQAAPVYVTVPSVPCTLRDVPELSCK